MIKVIDSDTVEGSLVFSAEVLVSTKQRQPLRGSAGFTLVELIVVSAIIGVLAGLALPAYNQFIESVKVNRTVSEIRTLEKDITARIVDGNPLPNSLADIGRDTLRDPWGKAYKYVNLATGTPRSDGFTDMNTDYDVYSLGPDGLTDEVDFTAAASRDDISRIRDGGWVGTGEDYFP